MSSCHKIFKVKTEPRIQLSGRALSSCTRFKQNQNFLLEVSGVTVSLTGVGEGTGRRTLPVAAMCIS